MIKCKLTGQYQPASVLCSLLSQTSLREQLVNSAAKSKPGPKTFPVEFKAASSPSVFREKSKEECDKAVLEALSRANQNAIQNGNVFIPFSKSLPHPVEVLIQGREGELTEAKHAGRDLAEQFIEKYPESFKIRFSDKMSMRKLTYVQEICRERRTDKAIEVFEQVLAGNLECLEDQKKDLDALLDLFAYQNTDNDTTQWPTSYNEQMMCHQYRRSIQRIYSKKSKTYPLPYSMSLFKTMTVENRNVQLISKDLLQNFPGLSVTDKKDIIKSFLHSDNHDNKSIENLLRLKDKNSAEQAGIHEKEFHASTTIPDGKSSNYISIMNDNSHALKLLSILKERDLVTSQNYDCTIQSAVRHYRPDLAWELYKEMRSKGLYPCIETVTDVVYSITHDVEPSVFIRNGVKKITKLLSDLAENPDSEITDELFLNLFYGVHLVPNRKAKDYVPSKGHVPSKDQVHSKDHVPLKEGPRQPTIIDPEYIEARAAVHKYNYNILNDMITCMKQGQVKLRYSIAFEMLRMHNLTVEDQPKPCFTIDLNNRLYELFHNSPEYFRRDLENEGCIKFVALVLSYARIHYRRYNIDKFYIKHRDNLIEIHKHYLQNPEVPGYSVLENILTADLNIINGALVPKGMFTDLESIRAVSPFQLYKDFREDNLEHEQFKNVIERLDTLTRHIESLNPYLADVDYVLKYYKLVLHECVKASDLCIKAGDMKHWTVHLMTFLEKFFSQLSSHYLRIFSYTEDTLRSLRIVLSNEDIEGAKSLKLSEENIMDVVNMASDAIQLLIDNEAMPTTLMVYMLINYTLLSGEHETAWKIISLYDTYKIPLDMGPLLRYIELTPNWETESEHYLSLIPRHQQMIIREHIKHLEKQHKLDVLRICQLRHYAVPPFQSQNNGALDDRASDLS